MNTGDNTLVPHKVAVNGTELTVWVAGEGQPVLLLHGFPDTHQIWHKQISSLIAAGYQVLLPDTRGCGESALDLTVEHYEMDNLNRDIIGILDHFKLEKVALIAHDWGALIGWYLVMRFPHRFTRYAALSVGHPYQYAHGGLMQKLRSYYVWGLQLKGLIEFLLKAGNWWLFRLLANCKEEEQQWIKTLSRPGRLTAGCNYYRANFSMIWTAPKTRVSVPVLGLYSQKDRYLVEKQMSDSGTLVDDFTYVYVPSAHHWLQIAEPELINSHLLTFLGAK